MATKTIECDQCGRAFESSGRGSTPRRCSTACNVIANRDRQRRFLARARSNRETLEALTKVLGADRLAELVESAS